MAQAAAAVGQHVLEVTAPFLVVLHGTGVVLVQHWCTDYVLVLH